MGKSWLIKAGQAKREVIKLTGATYSVKLTCCGSLGYLELRFGFLSYRFRVSKDLVVTKSMLRLTFSSCHYLVISSKLSFSF